MPEGIHRRRWFVLVLTLLIALQTATPLAWSMEIHDLGTESFPRLAEKQLPPTAKAAIAEAA